MGHIKAVAPEKAFVGVLAAAGTDRFCKEYGFTDWVALTGMVQVVPVRHIRSQVGGHQPWGSSGNS